MNYQEKVSTRADVRALYEKVIANPVIARYRGYTESKSYGWDAEAEDYIKQDGEVWFDNPSFDASFEVAVGSDCEATELLDEQLAEREEQIRELNDAIPYKMVVDEVDEQPAAEPVAEDKVPAEE